MAMRPRRLKNEINVVPYIDVMLVLLVIFMVTAPMMTTASIDVPSVGKAAQAPAEALQVNIRADQSWSLSLGGCGVKPAVVGSTNEDGTAVKDRPVTIPDLFATFYTLLGINYRTELEFEGRPVPLTENSMGTPVKEVL